MAKLVGESKRRNRKNTYSLMKRKKRAAKPTRLLFCLEGQESKTFQKLKRRFRCYF